MLTSHQDSERWPTGRWGKTATFRQGTSTLCSQTQKWSMPRKEHYPYYETLMRLCYILGALYLDRIKWYFKTIHVFLKETCCSCQKARNGIISQNLTKSIQQGLRAKHWTILKWPSFSPAVNPTEHLWKELNETCHMEKSALQTQDNWSRFMAPQRVHNSHWKWSKWIYCSNCLKRLWHNIFEVLSIFSGPIPCLLFLNTIILSHNSKAFSWLISITFF